MLPRSFHLLHCSWLTGTLPPTHWRFRRLSAGNVSWQPCGHRLRIRPCRKPHPSMNPHSCGRWDGRTLCRRRHWFRLGFASGAHAFALWRRSLDFWQQPSVIPLASALQAILRRGRGAGGFRDRGVWRWPCGFRDRAFALVLRAFPITLLWLRD